MDDRYLTKLFTFVKISQQVGNLSYDPKHKVGSILVRKDFSNIHSLGYNGNAAGLPNERDSMESGKSGFCHAEINTLIKSSLTKDDYKDYCLIITMTPCEMCFKYIINSGIKNIICLNEYGDVAKINEYAAKANIELVYLRDLIFLWYSKSKYLEEYYDSKLDFYTLLIAQLSRIVDKNKLTYVLTTVFDFGNISKEDSIVKYLNIFYISLCKSFEIA